MQQPYLIRSLPDAQGRFWAAAQQPDESFSVAWLRKEDGFAIKNSSHLGIGAALSRVRDMARYDKLDLDWSSLQLQVGELIIVESEVKGTARAEVRLFHSAAAYDEFRRETLKIYPDSEESEEVAALLAAGKLDEAWDLAVEDDGGKALWDTYFGSHSTTTEPNLVAFTDLPGWIQNTIKDSL